MTSFRTDDFTRWGAGLGRNLTPTEVDVNFWGQEARINDLETAPPPPPAIESFEVTGTQFYVHFVGGAVMGPYELPVAHYNARGEWVPLSAYAEMDTVTVNGSLYVVIWDHTSDTEFDPGANDGAGHDYYSLMLEPPGNSLPAGGATGQILIKSTSLDYATTWAWKTPEDGSAGQYLRQVSGTQDETEWGSPDASEISFTPVTGSSLEGATTVDEALEAVADSAGAGSAIGKQSIYLPAMSLLPFTTNGATVDIVEDGNMISTMVYPTTTKYAQFTYAMPKSWDGGDISFKLYWTHDTTSVNFDVMWEIFAASFAQNSNLTSIFSTSVAVTDTGGSADLLYITDETDPLTIVDADTSISPGENNLLVIKVSRDALNTSDTLAVDAKLIGVMIFYTTTAGTDD